MAHSVTLLTAENRSLRKANEALRKRRRAEKARICLGVYLTVEDTNHILAEKEVGEQLEQDIWKIAYTVSAGAEGKRRHNARTCQIDEAMSDVYSSD